VRHFCVQIITGAEMSNRHFGTSAEMCWFLSVRTPTYKSLTSIIISHSTCAITRQHESDF